MSENKQALALTEKTIEPILENGNGNHALVPTKNLPVAKQISNEQLIAEEKFLIEKETQIEKNYEGFRGYLRLFHVSRVIGMLSLYLYLDQYEMHHTQHLKQAEARRGNCRQINVAGDFGRKILRRSPLVFSSIYSFC